MRRHLWTTRLLPFHLGIVVALVACAWLGQWQYSRFTHDHQGHVVERTGPALDLRSVLTPGSNPSRRSIGQPVIVSGHYLSGKQLLLPNRSLHGRSGLWLLAPLQVDGGGVAAVVRGWVARSDAPEVATPTGLVTVTGLVQAAEPVEDERDASLPSGQASDASPVELLDAVDGRFYTALVVARSESPATAAEPAPVELWNHRSSGAAGLRNLAYALQWWMFAAFAVFMWWRVIPLTASADDEPDPHTDQVGEPEPVRTMT